jgi:predicted aldo/keto reductase-like oxidoreductase
MERRGLGRTGLEVGIIGLGTEHLEKSGENMEEVLRTAVEAGVNYIDAVYTDPEGRNAEFWDGFAPALKLYRDKLVVAGHWGPSDLYGPEESQRCFEGVLERVGNGHVEIAFLTVVDSEHTWSGWAQESLERLRRFQEQGRVGHIGLSGHTSSIALKAVRSGLIDVLMYGINLLGHDDEELRSLIQACVDQDVGLVAMKPYHGSTLFFAEGRPTGVTPTQCLAYVFSLPVSTAVPGVNNVEELRATLHYLEAAEEEKDFPAVVERLHQVLAGQCTYCQHCLPCPEEIQIGMIFWLVDQARGGVTADLQSWYAGHRVKASACTECGVCLERCPFDVDILAKMHRAVEVFEDGGAYGGE